MLTLPILTFMLFALAAVVHSASIYNFTVDVFVLFDYQLTLGGEEVNQDFMSDFLWLSTYAKETRFISYQCRMEDDGVGEIFNISKFFRPGFKSFESSVAAKLDNPSLVDCLHVQHDVLMNSSFDRPNVGNFFILISDCRPYEEYPPLTNKYSPRQLNETLMKIKEKTFALVEACIKKELAPKDTGIVSSFGNVHHLYNKTDFYDKILAYLSENRGIKPMVCAHFNRSAYCFIDKDGYCVFNKTYTNPKCPWLPETASCAAKGCECSAYNYSYTQCSATCGNGTRQKFREISHLNPNCSDTNETEVCVAPVTCPTTTSTTTTSTKTSAGDSISTSGHSDGKFPDETTQNGVGSGTGTELITSPDGAVDQNMKKGDSTRKDTSLTIVLSVVGVVILLAILIAIVAFVLLRRRRNQKRKVVIVKPAGEISHRGQDEQTNIDHDKEKKKGVLVDLDAAKTGSVTAAARASPSVSNKSSRTGSLYGGKGQGSMVGVKGPGSASGVKGQPKESKSPAKSPTKRDSSEPKRHDKESKGHDVPKRHDKEPEPKRQEKK